MDRYSKFPFLSLEEATKFVNTSIADYQDIKIIKVNWGWVVMYRNKKEVY